MIKPHRASSPPCRGLESACVPREVGRIVRRSCRPDRILAVLLVWLIVWPGGAWAADNARAAQGMAVRARKAFDAGDYPQSAHLYEEASALDAGNVDLLYAAARAHQLAGKLSRSQALFDNYLHRTTGRDDEFTRKAHSYLVQVRRGLAEEKSVEAAGQAKLGAHELAAHMYDEAARLDADRGDLALRAGVEYELAGQRDLALACYRQAQAAPGPESARQEAAVRARHIGGPSETPRERPAPEPAHVQHTAPEPARTEPSAQTRVLSSAAPASSKAKADTTAQDDRWTGPQVAGAVVAVAGGAVIVGGGIMFANAQSETGFKSGSTDQNSVDAANTKAIITIGAGIAILATGLVIYFTAPKSAPSVAVRPGGFDLAWRF